MLANNFWHHSVHRRLGETLHYYFLHLQPLDPTKIASSLEQLLVEKELGSIYCYKLFGRYDLLVRAWLHPNIVQDFPAWLREAFRNCEILKPFDVSVIEYAWYDKHMSDCEDGEDLLTNLTEDNIKAAQEGDADLLRERLSRAKLLLNNEQVSAQAIKFFVAIQFDRRQGDREDEIIREVIEYIKNDKDLFNEAVYRGHGECDILVKAQGNDFFAVSRLPNWVNEHFRGARTETYFSHDPHYMLGRGKIGRSTFDEIRGRDLFAQSIVPELYNGSHIIAPTRREEVERFLRVEARSLDIDSRFKIFIHEYALGYLQDRKTDMLGTLFEFFTAIEEYLRQNRHEFRGRLLGAKTKAALDKTGFSNTESKKYPALGDLFLWYMQTIRLAEQEYPDSGILWEDLVEIRNQTAHGGLDPGENWAGTVRVLMRYQNPLNRLLHLVHDITGEVFEGRFL